MRGEEQIRKIFTLVFVTLLVVICVPLRVQAVTIFTSFPPKAPSLAISQTQYAAAQFTPTADFLLDSLTISFFARTKEPLQFQLWDNKYVDVGNEIRGRPDLLLGSWISEPTILLPGFELQDVTVLTPDKPKLNMSQPYWLKILPGSLNNNQNGEWAGSLSFDGSGYSLFMLEFQSNNFEPTNVEPGNFLAFQVDGTAISEPTTALLLGLGLAGLGVARRRVVNV